MTHTHKHTEEEHENKMSKVELRLYLKLDKWDILCLCVNSNRDALFLVYR